MNFPEGLFGDGWSFGAFLALATVWLWCLRTAPWRRLADASQLNVWLGSVVVLMLIWSIWWWMTALWGALVGGGKR